MMPVRLRLVGILARWWLLRVAIAPTPLTNDESMA